MADTGRNFPLFRPVREGIVAAALTLVTASATAQVPDSARQENRQLQGLAQPAQILIDHWGIPHIYAGSTRDAFFLQGYNAARDRLWQIDLWRKRGLGLLAADFGAAYVDQDRAARLFLFRGDMASEWAAYGPDAHSQADAFVAGINAFVAEIGSGARPLPVEFIAARTRPLPWSVDDVVRVRSHGLSRNLAQEVSRARVTCRAGIEADRLRRRLEPAWTSSVPEGLDPCAIPSDVLEVYELGTQAVAFSVPTTSATLDTAELDGSNAWVIAPAKTTTGRPILASDPHRAVGVPSLRYVVHLNAPGLAVIGAGEPSLPGVSIGHNGQIAFGLTIFATDQEDLYVYDLVPGDPERYRYGAGHEAFTTLIETIKVKGGADRIVELKFSRHGPILHHDPVGGRAFALRSVWSEPGAAAYFGSSAYMMAQDWLEFRAATARWRTPSENLLFASTKGDIGWVAVGAAPARANWDGLLPVPGDGRYEWGGLTPADQLPSLYNPESGYFASANEMNLPADYPNDALKLGFEWADDSRARRLKEVLSGGGKQSLAQSMALQADDHSSTAVRLQRLIAPLVSTDASTREAIAMLKAWDARIARDSAAAALFEIWTNRHLNKALVTRLAPEAARKAIGSGSLDASLVWLESADAPAELRDALLLASLAPAMKEARERMGGDPKAWSWGSLHRAHFRHALAPIADPALRSQMEVGPLQIGGGMTTPRLAAYGPDFTMVHGASFKMVVDVGAWDNSVVINAPGQSGDPFSAHYRDLFPLWAEGRYVPMLYSREAVEQATASVINLTP